MFLLCQKRKKDIFQGDILKAEARNFFIELCVFIFFFIVAMSSKFWNSNSFYFSKYTFFWNFSVYCLNENYVEHYQLRTMKQIFIERLTDVEEIDYHFGFLELKTVLDFWKYLETTFLYGLHGHRNTTIAVQKERYIAFENLMMGPPRIRQVRVKSNVGCMVHPIFQKHFKDCYQRYAMSRENTSAKFKGYVSGSFSQNYNVPITEASITHPRKPAIL